MDQIKDIQKRLMVIEGMLEDIYESTITEYKRLCPICNNKVKVYLPFGLNLRREAQCPHCYSLERHRALWLYFQNHTDILDIDKRLRILHFAPEPVFYEKFSRLANVDYYPVDISPNFKGIRDVVDIQKIQYSDNMFDIIICSHVLEHIPDDLAAMSGLYRVLKPDGTAYLNTPVNPNLKNTLENAGYNTPELRTKYYGQHDHVRVYGMADYINKLEHTGFAVEMVEPNKNFSDSDLLLYGIFKNEKIFKCTYAVK